MSRERFLRAQLAGSIKRFNDESNRHKRMYRRLRYAVFGLTACSTVLAGLALAFHDLQPHFNVGVVLATAAVGVVASIEGLRKPGELWMHERMIHAALKDLQRELLFRLRAPDDPQATDEIFARMQDMLDASRDQWRHKVVGQGGHDPRQDSSKNEVSP